MATFLKIMNKINQGNELHLMALFNIILILIVLNMTKILYSHCGAREFVIPAHFTLGSKARTEERRSRGHVTEVQMA